MQTLQEVLSGYDWRKLKAVATEYGIEKPEGTEWVDLVPEIASEIEAAGKVEEFLSVDPSLTEAVFEPIQEAVIEASEGIKAIDSVPPQRPVLSSEPDKSDPPPASADKPSDYFQKIGVPLGTDGDKVRYDRHGNRLN